MNRTLEKWMNLRKSIFALLAVALICGMLSFGAAEESKEAIVIRDSVLISVPGLDDVKQEIAAGTRVSVTLTIRHFDEDWTLVHIVGEDG